MHPNITASFLKCFIIRIRKQKRRQRQKDFATEASAKKVRSQKSIETILYQSERWSRTTESLRTPKAETVLLARLHEVHRAIVVTSVVRVYVYVCVRVRVTLSVKVF